MDTKSQHMFLDIWTNELVNQGMTNKIIEIIRNNFTIVKEVSHEFTPQGETIVLILSESHCSIHTYPEHQYISIDIYICNMNKNLEQVKDFILKKIDYSNYQCKIHTRGHQ